MTTLVAVYGTLRKGYGNHYLLGKSPLVAEGRTAKEYIMRAAGFPVVHEPTPEEEALSSPVRVEVYSCTKEVVEDLDALEGHPDWYRRRLVTVVTDAGELEIAWMYIMQREYQYENWEHVPSGDYANYRRL